MTSIIQDVKGKIESAYINDAPFDKAKRKLEKKGYRIISLEENAMLRMQEGKNAYISQHSNYTREGVIYVPKKGKFLTKISPIMDCAKEATECHRNCDEFYINEDQIEKALEKSVRLDGKSISVSEFGEEPITDFVFGKYAKKYGLFLKDAGIKKIPFDLANMQYRPFARQVAFFWLYSGDGSGLDCGGNDLKDLYNSYRVRGIRNASAKSASKK